MKIELEPPITEWCRDCDYKDHYSFYSYHANCPKCGGSCLSHGIKEIKGEVKVHRNKGRYSLTSNEESYRYYFIGLDKQYSFVIDEELEVNCIWDLIEEIKEIVDGYILYGKKDELYELYEILNDESFIEEQECIIKQNKVMRLKYELYRELNS